MIGAESATDGKIFLFGKFECPATSSQKPEYVSYSLKITSYTGGAIGGTGFAHAPA